MHIREYPLLNTPHLVLVLLGAAEKGPATVEDCVRNLAALLDRADEHPPVAEDEMRRRFGMLRRQLAIARLVKPSGEEGFTLTERGREALEAHPQGFDIPDLMDYPEFARHVRGAAQEEDTGGPRIPAYDAGFAAYGEGFELADNPHPEDSSDHLAWENGWFEALDLTGV
jgi:hypothetical protein